MSDLNENIEDKKFTDEVLKIYEKYDSGNIESYDAFNDISDILKIQHP